MSPWKRAVSALLIIAASAAAADRSLLDLVMPEARMVSGINIERALASPIGQFFVSQMQSSDPGLQKFIGETGFDPRRDLKEILIASPAVVKNSQMLILVRGQFDPLRILAVAKKQGAVVRQFKGVPVMTGNAKDSKWLMQMSKQSTEPWFALLDGSTAAFGDAISVQGAIGRRGAATRLDPRIAARAQELSSRYDCWGYSMVPPSAFSGQMPDERLTGAMKGDVLRAITESSGGVRLGADIEIFGEAVTRSPKDAQALADVIRFFAGLLQLNQKDAKITGPAQLLQSLNLAADGNVMRLSMTIPHADVEKFIRDAQASARQARTQAPGARPAAAPGTPSPSALPAPPARSGGIVIHSSEGSYEIAPPK